MLRKGPVVTALQDHTSVQKSESIKPSPASNLHMAVIETGLLQCGR